MFVHVTIEGLHDIALLYMEVGSLGTNNRRNLNSSDCQLFFLNPSDLMNFMVPLTPLFNLISP